MEPEKTALLVPFAEKDLAKPLGARWDPEKRQWYWPGPSKNLPEGLKRWCPASASPVELVPEVRRKIPLKIPFEMKGIPLTKIFLFS